MADVPPPHLDDPRSAPIRRALALFGRGLLYSLAFWAVYAAIYRAPWSASSTSPSSDDELKRQVQAWKSFDEQQARSAASMDKSEEQLKRMDALLTSQEQLMARFERVIAGWEKASSAKR
jgi:hypothetical protein